MREVTLFGLEATGAMNKDNREGETPKRQAEADARSQRAQDLREFLKMLCVVVLSTGIGAGVRFHSAIEGAVLGFIAGLLLWLIRQAYVEIFVEGGYTNRVVRKKPPNNHSPEER